MNLIRVGKVKEVYELNNEHLMFLFTDNISVFDKIIPTSIPYKGESLCRTSEYWFKTLESMNIKTHYIERPDKNRMKVKRVEVLDKPTEKDKNYLIPLEFIVRHYVAGSIYDRFKSGKISKEDLGLNNVAYGDRLPEPYFEVTTKFEEYDRNIDFEEGMQIAGITKDEIMDVKEMILKIDDKIEHDVKKRGLIHVDGKKEFAFNSERDIMIVDTFGTADEDRWWDLKEYDNGNIVQLSKEFVRQYYRETGYYDELTEARNKGVEEPDIPALPDDMTKKVSDLYTSLFEKITGEKWR